MFNLQMSYYIALIFTELELKVWVFNVWQLATGKKEKIFLQFKN